MGGRKFRAGRVALALTAAGFCGLVPAAADPASPVRRPVIFLAGYDTSGQRVNSCTDGQSSFSEEIKERLSADGYPDDLLVDFCYDNGAQDLHQVSVQLGAFVKQVRSATGAARVDLLGYSMGGLPAYECVASGACQGLVDHFVAISTPFHGTSLAALICNGDPTHPCVQMQPNSAYLQQVATHGGATAGAKTWTVINAFADDAVPPDSTALSGAQRVTIPENNDGGPAISGFGLTNHGATPRNAQTVDAVEKALR